MTIVTVLLPRGTKEEASAARAALEKTGWKLVMGTAHSHTPGQSLSGDVVLIGPGPEALDEDVQGKLWKVPNIEALAKLDIKARKVAKEEPPATEQEQLQNMVTRREVEEPPPPPPAPEPEGGGRGRACWHDPDRAHAVRGEQVAWRAPLVDPQQ
jgi:hypothetical protein